MTAAFSPEDINICWREAFNAADIPALLELYEPGAVLIPAPGAGPVSGLDAIEACLRWLAGTGGKITYQPRFWLQNGDLAMGRIDFRLSGGAAPTAAPST